MDNDNNAPHSPRTLDDRGPVSTVELHISCTGLVNLDAFSLSDPLVVLYRKVGDSWEEFGRTEMIKDNLNPKFVRSFRLEYHFEEQQLLRFACYDIDNVKAGLDRQDFIGEAFCSLSEIVTAPGQKVDYPLRLPARPQARRGHIQVHIEEVQEMNLVCAMKWAGENLDKKDLFGKSDPFLVISRVREGAEYVPVLKTEVIRKTLNPSWRRFEMSVQHLCNGDMVRPLRFEVFDWNRSGKHEFIGAFETTLESLEKGTTTRFQLINDALKGKKRNYINSGTIILQEFKLTKVHTFLDYIRGGCEINLITAIDFTASNGNPMHSNSLHYNGGTGRPNDYLQALTAVGEILTPYDSDQNFPVFGFGAKLPPQGHVSHCFACNFNADDPEVKGLTGILSAYQNALSRVTLYGPTIFAQILRKAFEMAGEHCTQDQQNYQILLILTDGVLDDLQASVDEIVKGNNLPLSIIIVGIGNADFSKMDVLDADDEPLRSTWGEIARRDTVQFVPFRDFKGQSSSVLAKAVLEEVPGQLLSYMKSRGIVPNPPRPAIQRVNSQMPPQQAGQAQHMDANYGAGPRGQYADLSGVPVFVPPVAQWAAPGQGGTAPPPADFQHYVPSNVPQRAGGSTAAPYASPYELPPTYNAYTAPPMQQQGQPPRGPPPTRPAGSGPRF